MYSFSVCVCDVHASNRVCVCGHVCVYVCVCVCSNMYFFMYVWGMEDENGITEWAAVFRWFWGNIMTCLWIYSFLWISNMYSGFFLHMYVFDLIVYVIFLCVWYCFCMCLRLLFFLNVQRLLCRTSHGDCYWILSLMTLFTKSSIIILIQTGQIYLSELLMCI